jgi:NTE family protein
VARATLPDVLVLAAGGILGDAWMSGLLAGIEDETGLDFREVESYVGTSAGSIVAARLAAGTRPRRPRGRQAGADPGFVRDVPRRRRSIARDAARFAALPLAPTALALGAAAGSLVRRAALAALPDGRDGLDHLHAEIARSRVRFDGRLRVCAVDKGTGRRVVFGRPGAPPADVADAVVASCAIPAIFRPVTIGGRTYVDGGIWSLSNLDVAPAGRGTEVLCLLPSGSVGFALASPLGAFRAAAAAATEVEALALRARGARPRVIGPDREAAAVMGSNFMDPARARQAHAAGYRQGRSVGIGP